MPGYTASISTLQTTDLFWTVSGYCLSWPNETSIQSESEIEAARRKRKHRFTGCRNHNRG